MTQKNLNFLDKMCRLNCLLFALQINSPSPQVTHIPLTPTKYFLYKYLKIDSWYLPS